MEGKTRLVFSPLSPPRAPSADRRALIQPNPLDWDYNFPAGWKSNDVAAATDRVFQRIPGTTTPSMDGKAYLHEGFNVLSTGLAQGGWTKLDQPNSRPTQKNHTFGPTSYMFSGGERGGPLATYLVTASQRRSFTLWTNTAVKRVIRTGGHVTGVEVESTGAGGKCGTVKVTNYRGPRRRVGRHLRLGQDPAEK